MLKKSFRVLFGILGVTIGIAVGEFLSNWIRESVPPYGMEALSAMEKLVGVAIIAIIFGIIFFQVFPLITKQSAKVVTNIERDLQKVSGNDVILGIIGLIGGLIVALLVAQIYRPFFSNSGYTELVVNAVVFIIFGYLGIVVVRATGLEIATAVGSKAKGIAPMTGQEMTLGKYKKNKDIVPKIFDTSVIIDGRIAGILSTGFLEGPIVIPEFVLVELRHIADSSDALKRTRGRRGLDILNQIQQDYGIEIYNTESEKGIKEIPEVDVKLLKLAQIMGGKVVTNDFNLNKVASINNIGVLNINELANTLKPVVIPGEEMSVSLIKQGKESVQAIGYLDDGTMIVVEDGRKKIGTVAEITVTSVLQTAAGRMIFGRLKK